MLNLHTSTLQIKRKNVTYYPLIMFRNKLNNFRFKLSRAIYRDTKVTKVGKNSQGYIVFYNNGTTQVF